ncbi:MAG: hypothetical protein ABIL05_00590, partial [candidate division WOR-3 bacterium]
MYLSNTVDDRNGNNNKRLDPNEQANLIVSLKNVGTNATGVNGRLKTTNSYIEIRDSLANYGNINQGDTTNNFGD